MWNGHNLIFKSEIPDLPSATAISRVTYEFQHYSSTSTSSWPDTSGSTFQRDLTFYKVAMLVSEADWSIPGVYPASYTRCRIQKGDFDAWR